MTFKLLCNVNKHPLGTGDNPLDCAVFPLLTAWKSGLPLSRLTRDCKTVGKVTKKIRIQQIN